MTPEQRETLTIFADCVDDELAGSETRGFTWAVVSVDRERYRALRAALAPAPTCGTCRYRIAADRNCQLLVMPMESGASLRPGDVNFGCTFHAPTEPTR